MITLDEFRRFAPRAREDYATAITSAEAAGWMSYYGILESREILCGFMATCGHESGGFTIVRENMSYISASRLRAVWPSRFRNKSDSELAGLLRNPRALSEAVYGGRMGNVPGTSDAYDFRGAGPGQTTGKGDFISLGEKIGVDFIANPSLCDDVGVLFAAFCAEWGTRGCNQAMAEGDFEGASCIVNAGKGAYNSVKSGRINPKTGRPFTFAGIVVGMEDRKAWYARARNIWMNDPDVLDVPAALEQTADTGAAEGVPGQEAHWSSTHEVA